MYVTRKHTRIRAKFDLGGGGTKWKQQNISPTKHNFFFSLKDQNYLDSIAAVATLLPSARFVYCV